MSAISRRFYDRYAVWLFALILLFSVGLCTFQYNVAQNYAVFEYALGPARIAYLACVPLLRGCSYRKMLAVFSLSLAPAMIYPLLLGLFGAVSLPSAYLGLAGFFLLGAALLAVGRLMDSLFPDPKIAAPVTLAVLLALYFLPGPLKAFGPFAHMDTFIVGLIDPGDAAYFVCFTGICVALAAHKRRVLTLVLVAALALGMGDGKLPAIDLTKQRVYTLSDRSERVVQGLTQPVTLTLMAAPGEEDARIWALLERYAETTGALTLQKASPDAATSTNSVRVSSRTEARLIDYYDIYVSDYTLCYDSYDYAFMLRFEGERAVTDAIYSVTGALPTVSVYGGTLNASLAAAIGQRGLTLAEDVQSPTCVMLYAPPVDLTTAQADELIAYLNAGGGMLLLTDCFDVETMPNLMRVTGHMGMTARAGPVTEGDPRYCLRGYDEYLLPSLAPHAVTDPVSDTGRAVIVPRAQALALDAAAKALLFTSDAATAGDEKGPFVIAAASEVGAGRLTWFGSAQLADDAADGLVSGGNGELLASALNWTCGRDEGFEGRHVDLSGTPLETTDSDRWLLGALLIGVIPGLTLLHFCARRARK